MPPTPGQVAQAGDGQQQQEEGGLGRSFAKFLKTLMLFYFFTQFLGPNKPPVPSSQLLSNVFQKGENLPLLFLLLWQEVEKKKSNLEDWIRQIRSGESNCDEDMWLYLSEEENFKDFGNKDTLVWHESNVAYAIWDHASSRSKILTYYPSENLKHNGSLYAHVFFARSGYSPDPNHPDYQPFFSFSSRHSVVVYLPKLKVDKKKSLLGNHDTENEMSIPEVKDDNHVNANEEERENWISYWKPNITLHLVDDFTRYPLNAVPPNIADYMSVDPKKMGYYPIVYLNEFWLLKEKLIPLNDTVLELPLYLELGPISRTKWQIFIQMEKSFQMQSSYGSVREGEADEIKRVFLEGNPYLLAVTMVVSLFHSLFDILAFKNDIQFWNKNKSMEGLSAKSVIVNFICQLIIFLYLLDNETSWMILISSGMSCCVEFWKIGKAMHVEIDRSRRFPVLKIRDRETYATNKTKEYDDLAMKYLSYVLFFLVACSSVYSLMYKRHKSWYSWILSSLASSVHMFGFIMMCPQLFLNYKMKSVAHLPWRQMTYKFLNTIIDDLFAFVIKMPTLHRLSVFRDDLIFVIYLYQRWIYPVDKKRVNEFGFGGEEEDQSLVPSDATAKPTRAAKTTSDATAKPTRAAKTKSRRKEKAN